MKYYNINDRRSIVSIYTQLQKQLCEDEESVMGQTFIFSGWNIAAYIYERLLEKDK